MTQPTPTHGDARDALLERAADLALFGGEFAVDEIEHARRLGIDLEHERLLLELAAAEVAVDAAQRAHAQIPANLAGKLHASAAAHAAPQPIAMPAPRTQRWLLATAAGFALGAAATAIVLQSTPRERRDAADPVAFVRDHPRAVHWKWTGTEDPHIVGAVGGEAYFDPASAEGVLEIEGLAANDPAREQYQLWIFDEARDERFPVDGGVFDVRGTGRACIPVRARLPVNKPVLFAVTVEPPGGVVVSARRIALVAKP